MGNGTGSRPAVGTAGGPGGAADGAVLVGVECGDESVPVVRWAAREAARRGAVLLLLHAEQPPVATDALGTVWAGGVLEELDREARAALERLAALAGGVAPGVRVRTELVHEHRRHALLRAAARACLVVTGPGRLAGRRGGVLGELVLGSTCLSLVAHAPCPVVVVRAPVGAEDAGDPGDPGGAGDGGRAGRAGEGSGGAGGVVLGSDGSPASRAAEDFALAHAAAAGEGLTVVRVWRPPAQRLRAADPAGWERAREVAHRQAAEGLQRTLERVRAAAEAPPVGARLLEDAHPAEALLGAAAGARLLVVGSRGRGALACALLGSTSHEVLHRAGGPVAVVPDAARRERWPRGGDGSGEVLTQRAPGGV